MSDVYRIKENSFWAMLAAKKMKTEKMAMVIGKTIHLHNTSTTEMLQNRRWLRHELAHIRQFQHYGTLKFLFLYLIESIRNGYYQNRFEKEARTAEQDPGIEGDYVFRPNSRQQRSLS